MSELDTSPAGGLDDHALAHQLAEESGRLLLTLRTPEAFADSRTLKDTGDRVSHEFLMKRLADLRPGDAVLSEEGADDPVRLSASRVWIVDPLDGTREFSEAGRSDWAVHVALWQDGALVAGAVALPALGTVLSTGHPRPRPSGPASPPRIAVSRTRPPAVAEAVAAALGAELVPMGSAGAKVAAVVRGEVDAYVHGGGQYEWDSAAPVAVAQAAGVHACRLDGSPLAYNRPNPLLPDLVVCDAALASAILTVTARESTGDHDR
jgi:3'(2'), 5'-bisphosphate nucleotidase